MLKAISFIGETIVTVLLVIALALFVIAVLAVVMTSLFIFADHMISQTYDFWS